MERQIATTQSQSDRLLRCGVSADTADMSWNKAKAANRDGYTWLLFSENFLKSDNSDRCVPAWSLSVLLGLLFKSGHILSMQYERNEYRLQSFYSSGDFVSYGTTPIEACVKAIEWLTSNGYKLNEQ